MMIIPNILNFTFVALLLIWVLVDPDHSNGTKRKWLRVAAYCAIYLPIYLAMSNMYGLSRSNLELNQQLDVSASKTTHEIFLLDRQLSDLRQSHKWRWMEEIARSDGWMDSVRSMNSDLAEVRRTHLSNVERLIQRDSFRDNDAVEMMLIELHKDVVAVRADLALLSARINEVEQVPVHIENYWRETNAYIDELTRLGETLKEHTASAIETYPGSESRMQAHLDAYQDLIRRALSAKQTFDAERKAARPYYPSILKAVEEIRDLQQAGLKFFDEIFTSFYELETRHILVLKNQSASHAIQVVRESWCSANCNAEAVHRSLFPSPITMSDDHYQAIKNDLDNNGGIERLAQRLGIALPSALPGHHNEFAWRLVSVESTFLHTYQDVRDGHISIVEGVEVSAEAYRANRRRVGRPIMVKPRGYFPQDAIVMPQLEAYERPQSFRKSASTNSINGPLWDRRGGISM